MHWVWDLQAIPCQADSKVLKIQRALLSPQDVEPEEEYILVIDADMIMRSPFLPKAMGVSPGIRASATAGVLCIRLCYWVPFLPPEATWM